MTGKDINEIQRAGSRIKAIMKFRGDKISNICIEMGISYSQLKKLLNDKCRWSEDKILWFSKKYQIPFETLAYGVTAVEVNEYGVVDIVTLMDIMMNDFDNRDFEYKKLALKYYIGRINDMLDLM